ncbi:MAG: hypothetical protein IKQ59_13850 [Prevotella sp.]|nr:hypothetical protein [Prevotella sp.]
MKKKQLIAALSFFGLFLFLSISGILDKVTGNHRTSSDTKTSSISGILDKVTGNHRASSYTKSYNSYREAVKEEDFEAAHELLDEIYEEFQDTWNSNFSDLHYSNNRRAIIESSATKYSQAASYVLCAEARYIISNDVEGALDRIAYLFNEIRVMGEKSDHYAPHGVEEYQQECAKVDCYKQTVKYNNELCDVVLNLAILHHNQQLAELALSYYRENGKVTDSWNCDMEWSYDDRDAALGKYEKAFEGKFKPGSPKDQKWEDAVNNRDESSKHNKDKASKHKDNSIFIDDDFDAAIQDIEDKINAAIQDAENKLH